MGITGCHECFLGTYQCKDWSALGKNIPAVSMRWDHGEPGHPVPFLKAAQGVPGYLSHLSICLQLRS